MIKEFIDPDIGTVKIVYNSRAKRVIARRRSGIVHLTVPQYYNQQQIYASFLELKPRIAALNTVSPVLFTPETEFKTLGFELQIVEHDLNNFYITFKNKILSIACPRNTDFRNDDVQQLIRENIEKALRLSAKKIIPLRIEELSSRFGFIYNIVKINKSRSRWGSCSSKKDLNISYFTLLLPKHLLDFIILHELCHTHEMNHGTKFWKLLDKVTNNNAKKLTRELNSTSIFW